MIFAEPPEEVFLSLGGESEPSESSLEREASESILAIHTLGVAKLDIPNIETNVLLGGSAKVRSASNMEDIDVIWPDRAFRPPNPGKSFQKHCEEVVVNKADMVVTNKGIPPEKVSGKITMHVSTDAGVCSQCIAGLNGADVKPGILKQFSEKYPNLEITITSEVGPNGKLRGRGSRQYVHIKNGKYID